LCNQQTSGVIGGLSHGEKT